MNKLQRAKQKAREIPKRKNKRRAARGILADLRACLMAY